MMCGRILNQVAMPGRYDSEVRSTHQSRLFDSHDKVVITSKQGVESAVIAKPAGDDGELERRCCESLLRFLPIPGELPGTSTGNSSSEVIIVDYISNQVRKLRTIIWWPEHHHSLNTSIDLPSWFGLRCLAQIPPDNEVSEAVTNKVDFVDSFQASDDRGKRLGMVVERASCTGVAKVNPGEPAMLF